MTAHRSLVRGLVKQASPAPLAPPVAAGHLQAPAQSSVIQTTRALNRFLGQAAVPATLGASTLFEDEDTRSKALHALAGLAMVTAIPGIISSASKAINGEQDPNAALAEATKNLLPVLAYGLARGNV